MKSDRLFAFVVRYLAPLKFVPVMPHLFDGLLRMKMLLLDPDVLGWIDELEAAARMMDGVNLSQHKYGGMQFNYLGVEIGHLHSNGLLDILYSKTLKTELKVAGRVLDHHLFNTSGWTSFYLRSHDDVRYAKKLLAIACQRGRKSGLR